MSDSEPPSGRLGSIEARLRRLEDEADIRRLVLTYGPAADAGLTTVAGDLWLDDGLYDWDAAGNPHEGSSGVGAMLRGDGHQGLIAAGVAHVTGPLRIDLDGDLATALSYSFVARREDERWFLWRVSAVRWELERTESAGWRIRQRTNRLLDETGAGRELFEASLEKLTGEPPSGRLDSEGTD